MVKRRSVATLTALLVGACVWPSPERQLLLNFFQACRVFDTTVLARLATIPCNPQSDGVVQDFQIVAVENLGDTAGAASKAVTLDARIRPLGGSPETRRLAVTLKQIDGRWMVAGVMRLPASQTSPEASSAPPS